MSKIFTTEEVASHGKKDDLYVVVDEDVYDLTQFQSEHPGGQKSTYSHRHGGTTSRVLIDSQSCSGSQAKMPRNNFGNTTTKAS